MTALNQWRIIGKRLERKRIVLLWRDVEGISWRGNFASIIKITFISAEYRQINFLGQNYALWIRSFTHSSYKMVAVF